MGRVMKFESSHGHTVKRRLEKRGGADEYAFDPKDLTGLTLWLKADSLSQDTGYIAELIVYDSSLSERKLKLIHRYLADKYDLGGISTPRI